MAIGTFTELKTAMANWMARSDLTDRLPEFIQLGEARINREAETRSQEKRATAALTADDGYVSLPTDLRTIRHVKLNTNPITNLVFMSPRMIDKEYASTGTGKPKAYSIVGTEVLFRPIPDSAYTAEILYLASIDALGDSTATNTFLTRHPDLYLHASLSEAFGYLMDETRQQIHDQYFTRCLDEIKRDEEKAKWGTGSLVMQTEYGEMT